MKNLFKEKITIFIPLLLGVAFLSCSEQKEPSKDNSKNDIIIDSLLIEKSEKSIEIKGLNSELDSLKKLRDSLKIITN